MKKNEKKLFIKNIIEIKHTDTVKKRINVMESWHKEILQNEIEKQKDGKYGEVRH